MATPKLRVALLAGVAVIVVWCLAVTGFRWAQQSKVTSDKVLKYMSSVNFAALDGKPRAVAIAELADKINALSLDERLQMHAQGAWDAWFQQMTEPEKTTFVEATMPPGIKQMMTAFEQMPADARQHTIDEAMKQLRQAHELPIQNGSSPRISESPGNSPLTVSAEVEQRIRTLGLKTFYLESSAQMKAEAAPLLEEMQRLMASGNSLH